MINILIAGDYCPCFSDSCENGNNLSLAQSIQHQIKNANLSFVNLECPLTKGKYSNHIEKQGPTLMGPVNTIDTIKQIGFTGVTLANNHILDYGIDALKQTLAGLDAKGIEHVGAGLSKADASKVLYSKVGGEIIAIINCCEHEFSIVTDEHGGANPLDCFKQFYQIKEAKEKADYVVMIIHGGVEHFQYPTPRMLKQYRFFIDAGADAVINHHQHCTCGYEVYNGKPIFYGIGNFFFPWKGKNNSIWNMGYIIELTLDKSGVNYKITPYRQCDNSFNIELLGGEEVKSFNKMMEGLCSTIQDETKLKKIFQLYNKENNYFYKKMLEPYSGRVMNALYRRGLLPSFIGRERVLALIDFIGCESHYERVMDYLVDKYKQFFNE